MSGASEATVDHAIYLAREAFAAVFDVLHDQGYEVIGPTIDQEAIVYDRINWFPICPAYKTRRYLLTVVTRLSICLRRPFRGQWGKSFTKRVRAFTTPAELLFQSQRITEI